MSYLDEHDEIQKNIEESRFSETAEYLVNHFEYSNSVARNQSETSKSKLSGALVGILSDDQYQQTFVKYDENENVVLFKKIDNDPNSIILDISDNKAMRIPIGTTAERPTVAKDGYMRINTTTDYLEIYTNGTWGALLKSDQAGAYIEGYVDTYIEDISRNINDKVTRDISNVIGGASESLDTLLELENYVTDLSDGQFATLVVDVLDMSGRESQHYVILSNEIVDLSSESVRDISDLSSITFSTINEVDTRLSNEITTVVSQTSYEVADISDTISDLSINVFQTIDLTESQTSADVLDLSSYTSSELSREISDLSSETVRDVADLSSITFHTISSDVLDLSNYESSELTRQSLLTSSEITDLSNYTSSELHREISDLSSETVRDITDLSTVTFQTIASTVTDLSNYTSSELHREISDLSSETVRDIEDLSSLTFHTIASTITDLSNYTSGELSLQSLLTSSEITDLSSYTSSELHRRITDLSNSTTTRFSIERSTTSREVSTVYSYTSRELYRKISDLSSESVRDISDLSSLVFNTINTNVTDLSNSTTTQLNLERSTTIAQISDLSSYTSSELNLEISIERSTVVRDLSDMSGSIHHIIDDLIGNAPYYLDTLEEIAFVLGDPTEPSGGDMRTVIQKIYSVSQDIYDLSQTVAGVDGDFRNLNGRLTVNAYSVPLPNEDVVIEAIGGDISMNQAIRIYNNHNIILGNASTGDTITSSSTGNILIGSGTDISNSNMSYSTGIGHGIDLSGSRSSALGYLAKTNGLNSTAIGYNSYANGDNVIQLGNTEVEYVNTNGVVTMSSDSRLKANIETIPYALEKVSALRGVTYTRTDLPNKDTVYMGLIAQETEKIVPEVVNNNGEYKSIMYSNLMGLLVEAVKDLDINHRVLDGKQSNLERELNKIKTVIREKLRKLNNIKNILDVRSKK